MEKIIKKNDQEKALRLEEMKQIKGGAKNSAHATEQ